MKRTSIVFSKILVLLIFLSLSLMAKSANAQAISKPAAPEFTVKLSPSYVEVTIKNQPHNYDEINGSKFSLYYSFRFKDHYGLAANWNYDYASIGTYLNASSSNYTSVSFPLDKYPLKDIAKNGTIDLEVMALVGNIFPINMGNVTAGGFEGVESDWSNMQTVTITHVAFNTSSNLTIIVAIPIVIFIIILASSLLYRRHQKTSKLKSKTV